MTEQPDTAAIRHSLVYFARQDGDGWAMATMRDLCDALDAARAEPALDIAYVDVLLAKISELAERAEAAEARISELERSSDEDADLIDMYATKCDNAEARIADALAYCDRRCHCDPFDYCVCFNPITMRRLLTEGTGQ